MFSDKKSKGNSSETKIGFTGILFPWKDSHRFKIYFKFQSIDLCPCTETQDCCTYIGCKFTLLTSPNSVASFANSCTEILDVNASLTFSSKWDTSLEIGSFLYDPKKMSFFRHNGTFVVCYYFSENLN